MSAFHGRAPFRSAWAYRSGMHADGSTSTFNAIKSNHIRALINDRPSINPTPWVGWWFGIPYTYTGFLATFG